MALFLVTFFVLPVFGQQLPGKEAQSQAAGSDSGSDRFFAEVEAAGARFGNEVTRGVMAGTVTPATIVGTAVAAGIAITLGSDSRYPTINIVTSSTDGCQ